MLLVKKNYEIELLRKWEKINSRKERPSKNNAAKQKSSCQQQAVKNCPFFGLKFR